MSHSLAFTAITGHGDRPLSAAIDRLIIAGWTGRDAAAVEAHIEELARLGVARPKTTPIFYQVAAHLLTTGGAIEVAGPDTSGEVEPVVVSLADGLWVGVGSDHTDRVMEAQGVTLSKQLCAKPVSSELWPYEEVAAHWDRLVLRSFMTNANGRRVYQEGPAASLRAPPELMAKYLNKQEYLPPGSVMFGGTLAVPGGLAPGRRFEIELEDPILGRTLRHAYDILILPVEG
jgi:hypothetical protein